MTVAAAPAYVETTKTGSEGTTTEPQSEPKTLQSEAQSHGDAPTSAPAGESAPAVPVRALSLSFYMLHSLTCAFTPSTLFRVPCFESGSLVMSWPMSGPTMGTRCPDHHA